MHDETYGHTDGEVRKFSFFYDRTRTDTIDKVKLEPTEVAEVRWISVSDFKELFRIHPEPVIISDATQLWQNILANLDSVVAKA